MIDERTIGFIVDSIGFATVETDPKSIAATIADRYPMITLEFVNLLSVNFYLRTHDEYFIIIKT
jgi:hypothetical protein